MNLTGGTLTCAMRPSVGAGGRANPAGPLQVGLELAERLEQRTRGRLLETSLPPAEAARLTQVVQDAQDAAVALRTARYAWQISVLLVEAPGGVGVNARLRRLAGSALEMNGRVVGVLEGQEEARAVASQYRDFLAVREEVAGAMSEGFAVSGRLGRAALWSLTLCAESMARVAARAALPQHMQRPAAGQRRLADLNDGLLNPLP